MSEPNKKYELIETDFKISAFGTKLFRIKAILNKIFKKKERHKINDVDLKIGPQIKTVSKVELLKSYDRTYCPKSMVSYDEVHDFDR